MKKLLRFLLGGYLTFLFLPYIFILFMYLFLKKFATPGSFVEKQVIDLEVELVNLVIGLVNSLEPKFLLINIFCLFFIVLAFYLLKKYKIVIPRKVTKE